MSCNVSKALQACVLAGVLGTAVAVSAEAAASSGAAPTVAELVAKNNQAEGGRRMRELRSVRLTGTLKIEGAEESSPLLMEFVPPRQKVRMDIGEKGALTTSAYDGAVGWERKDGEASPTSRKLSGDDLRAIREMADFQGPLFDAAAKGNKVEYLGRADVDGVSAYKLRLTTAAGDETTIFLDASTYLDIREETTRGTADAHTDTVTTLGAFKTFDGVTLPTVVSFQHARSLNGGSFRSSGSERIEIQKVELDIDIPAARFARP